jgi:hypothetical protein
MKTVNVWAKSVCMAGTLLMLLSSPLMAEMPGPADPVELEAFFDELMLEQLAENHVAGATVSVVRDGQLFFSKGYGYADVCRAVCRPGCKKSDIVPGPAQISQYLGQPVLTV